MGNKNTYDILKSCLTGSTLNVSIDNTYEVFNAVYDQTNDALKVTIDGGIHSLSGYTQTEIDLAIASAIVGGVYYQGAYNPVTNTPNLTTPTITIVAGYMWSVTSAGTFFSSNVEIGDSIIAAVDSPTVESDWVILQTNLDAANIKTLYESNPNTNAFTDANVLTLGSALQPADLNDYYTETEADANFLSADTALFDGEFSSLSNTPTDISGYGITDAYTKTEVDNNFLSGDTFIPTDFYSQAEADANFLSANTSLFDGEFSSLSNTPTDISGYGITDAYTKTEVDNNFLSGDTFIPTDFYSQAEADANFLSADTSLFDGEFSSLSNTPTDISGYGITDAYTMTETDANFLSADTALSTTLEDLTDTTITTPANEEILVYDGSKWVNSAATWFDITDPEADQILVYNGTDWVNSANTDVIGATEQWVTDNFLSGDTFIPTDFYSQAEADANFLSASTSLFDGEYSSLANVPDFDSMYLSANTFIPTDFYSQSEADANFLSANTSLFDGAFSSLTSKPTTISGYGITDAYTKTEVNNNFLSGNTTEQIDLQIEITTGSVYKIVPNAYYDFEILGMYLESDADSFVVTLSGNSSAITGLANVSGNTTGEDYDSTATTISVGQNVELDVVSGDATWLYASIEIRRV